MPRLFYTLLLSWVVVTPLYAQAHFGECATQTSDNATLVFEEGVTVSVAGEPLSTGDEVAVFTPEGLCAGVIVWEAGVSQALTAWADDPITPQTDGFRRDEPFHFRLWQHASGVEVGTNPNLVEADYQNCDGRSLLCNPEGAYKSGMLYYLDALTWTEPQQTGVEEPASKWALQAYPNPFRGSVRILLEGDPAEDVEVTVFDVLGRPVAHLQLVQGGAFDWMWEAEELPAGVYIVRAESATHVAVRSLTRLR